MKEMCTEINPNNSINKLPDLWIPTPRERSWLEIYPNGFDVPGSLKLAERYIGTIPVGNKVLEVGCGPGRVIAHLIKEKGVKATGVDINHAAVNFARERYGNDDAKFKVMDGTKLKFASDSFDHVIMTGVIGGVESDVREKLMAESFRVVRPGGTVAVAEFRYNDDSEKKKKYDEAFIRTKEPGTRIIKIGDRELIVKHFTEDELLDLYNRAGFISVQTQGEFIETPGLGDKIVEARRQYTIWGTKPSGEQNLL
ncbi:MAG: class I SAM-dependent methyltransferase [Candidatus Levybacteria bacterium]|nr:class I SAM-dependent methyltransferase [Candidatus Levybacteria bacterium]